VHAHPHLDLGAVRPLLGGETPLGRDRAGGGVAGLVKPKKNASPWTSISLSPASVAVSRMTRRCWETSRP
jgi:hypothetical protein